MILFHKVRHNWYEFFLREQLFSDLGFLHPGLLQLRNGNLYRNLFFLLIRILVGKPLLHKFLQRRFSRRLLRNFHDFLLIHRALHLMQHLSLNKSCR